MIERILGSALLAIIAALFVLLFNVERVFGHEAPSGWMYPMECCSNNDCAEMPEGDTPKPLAGGDWLLKTGEVVPRSKVKWSPDGRYHLCRMGELIFCLFVPPSSS